MKRVPCARTREFLTRELGNACLPSLRPCPGPNRAQHAPSPAGAVIGYTIDTKHTPRTRRTAPRRSGQGRPRSGADYRSGGGDFHNGNVAWVHVFAEIGQDLSGAGAGAPKLDGLGALLPGLHTLIWRRSPYTMRRRSSVLAGTDQGEPTGSGVGVGHAVFHPRPLCRHGDGRTGLPRAGRPRRRSGHAGADRRQPATEPVLPGTAVRRPAAGRAGAARPAAPAAATGSAGRPRRCRSPRSSTPWKSRSAPPAAPPMPAACAATTARRRNAARMICGANSASRSGCSWPASPWPTWCGGQVAGARPAGRRCRSRHDLSRRQRHRAAAPGGARRGAGGAGRRRQPVLGACRRPGGAAPAGGCAREHRRALRRRGRPIWCSPPAAPRPTRWRCMRWAPGGG